MAYSSGPPDPAAPNGPSGFAIGRLSQEEAEGFAAAFRPSWELDEAFSGPGSLLDGGLPALEGQERDVDVLAAPRSLNGAHVARTSTVPPAAQVAREPERSIIIDPSIPIETNSPAAPQVQRRAPVLAPIAAAPKPATARSVEARPFVEEEPAFARRAPTKMWVGLAGAIVLIVGAVGWLSLSGEQRAAPPVAVEPKPTAKTAVAPPAAQTSATPRVSAPVALPARGVLPASPTAAAPPPPVAPTAVAPTPVTPAATPAAPPSPARPAAWPPRQASPPQWAPPPRPAARPKGNGTIVRDVPF